MQEARRTQEVRWLKIGADIFLRWDEITQKEIDFQEEVRFTPAHPYYGSCGYLRNPHYFLKSDFINWDKPWIVDIELLHDLVKKLPEKSPEQKFYDLAKKKYESGKKPYIIFDY